MPSHRRERQGQAAVAAGSGIVHSVLAAPDRPDTAYRTGSLGQDGSLVAAGAGSGDAGIEVAWHGSSLSGLAVGCHLSPGLPVAATWRQEQGLGRSLSCHDHLCRHDKLSKLSSQQNQATGPHCRARRINRISRNFMNAGAVCAIRMFAHWLGCWKRLICWMFTLNAGTVASRRWEHSATWISPGCMPLIAIRARYMYLSTRSLQRGLGVTPKSC